MALLENMALITKGPAAETPVGTVVCEVDGSRPGADAARAAIVRCQEDGATLELVSVLKHVPEGSLPDMDEQETTELQAQLVRESQQALIDAIGAARKAGIPFEVTQRCC